MHGCFEHSKLCLRAGGVSQGKCGDEYLGFVLEFLVLSSFFIVPFKTNACASQSAVSFVSTRCKRKMKVSCTDARFVLSCCRGNLMAGGLPRGGHPSPGESKCELSTS